MLQQVSKINLPVASSNILLFDMDHLFPNSLATVSMDNTGNFFAIKSLILSIQCFDSAS